MAVVVLSLLTVSIHAEIKWMATDYDFGVIKEIAGTQEGKIDLVNLGPDSTFIRRVKASCGCTATSYTTKVLAPGDTASVRFRYDPKGRPGRFDKNVKVYIGKDENPVILTLHGSVIGDVETMKGKYPIEAGALRLSTKILDAGDVTYGSARHLFLYGYNQTTDTIHPQAIDVPEELTVNCSPEYVGPGDIVTISAYFNTLHNILPGDNIYSFNLESDNRKESPTTKITFSARVVPDTSGMTPDEIAMSGKCYLYPERIDLGVISDNKEKKAEFTISNEGKSPLRITRIYSTNKAIKVTRYPVNLKAGKKGVAEIKINTEELPDGAFAIKANVMSDDPLNPIREITVCGYKER
jgi:hypothetical protein